MVGPANSVIGVSPEEAVTRFLTQTPQRFTVVKNGPTLFGSVLMEVDKGTGRATSIQRVDREI